MPGSYIGMVAVICCLGGPFVCGILGIICSTIEKVSRQRADSNLKMLMIQRGFSASEIERVLNAKVDPKAAKSVEADVTNWKPIAPAKPV